MTDIQEPTINKESENSLIVDLPGGVKKARISDLNIFFQPSGNFSSWIGILFLVLDDSCKVSAQSENVNENLEKNIKANPLTFFSRFLVMFSVMRWTSKSRRPTLKILSRIFSAYGNRCFTLSLSRYK